MSIDESIGPQLHCEPNRCPLCGGANGCQLCGACPYKGPCWCVSVKIPDELLARVPPELRNRACICQDCVNRVWQGRRNREPATMLPGDFYFDGSGLIVLKAGYHLRRCYCCGSRCQPCPYPRNSYGDHPR